MADTAALHASVAARYRGCGRFAFHYVRGKLRADPLSGALLALAAAETLGTVADVGCGRGQFAAMLLQAGAVQSVIGLERNETLLAQARRAMNGMAFEGRVQDLSRTTALPAVDTVLLFDVLYQLASAVQTRVLEAAAVSARRRILVRTVDPAAGWRSRFTQLAERAGRSFWPHAGSRVNPLPIAAIAAPLEARGFAVRILPCHAGTPFANLLLVAEARG